MSELIKKLNFEAPSFREFFNVEDERRILMDSKVNQFIEDETDLIPIFKKVCEFFEEFESPLTDNEVMLLCWLIGFERGKSTPSFAEFMLDKILKKEGGKNE